MLLCWNTLKPRWVDTMCIWCLCLMLVKCSIVPSVWGGDPREVLGCHRSWWPAPWWCPTMALIKVAPPTMPDRGNRTIVALSPPYSAQRVQVVEESTCVGGVGVGGLSRKWRRSGSLARILVTGGRRERELSSIKLKTSNCNNQTISFLPLGHGRGCSRRR